MALKNFHRIIAETPEEVDNFVEHSMDILDRIHELLEQKFDGRQKLLAEKMGKSEAEVSKMLNGVQNFTLKTISKLETAFGERIIGICSNKPSRHFAFLRTAPVKGERQIAVGGKRTEEEFFERIGVHSGRASISKIMPAGS
jgi:transcriptional regulator with XRE-family HTH domain